VSHKKRGDQPKHGDVRGNKGSTAEADGEEEKEESEKGRDNIPAREVVQKGCALGGKAG